MFYQINFEKRRDLVQDVIDRLTRLNAEQGAQYLQELEALHEKFNLNLKAIYDVPMKLKVVLGQAEFKVSDLLKLNKGDKIELDKKPGDPVDLFVNDKLVAKGEIVLIDDKVGLTLTEIIAND